MRLPNYKNGSIINLMSVLAKELGGKSAYAPLKGFNPKILGGKNIVLLVIDALGYEFLKKHGQGSFLYGHIKQKITSIFPSTTVAGVTGFLTGLPAQQHGLTGWFMYLKEAKLVSRILPFTTRGAGEIPLSKKGVKFQDIFREKTFFQKIKTKSYVIQHKDYAFSAYSRALSKGAKILAFKGRPGFFKTIKQVLKKGTERKYVYAYWHGFDSVSHKFGSNSRQAIKHFYDLDKGIKKLAKQLKNTVVIITADHGQMETTPSDIIKLENHPALAKTLAKPLCGECRLAYCYVKPAKAKEFKNYIKKNFRSVCYLYDSNDLIKNNYFGLFQAHKKLKERVGDYALIMKKNYILKDFVQGEEKKISIGNHGGVSREEMVVPLIIV